MRLRLLFAATLAVIGFAAAPMAEAKPRPASQAARVQRPRPNREALYMLLIGRSSAALLAQVRRMLNGGVSVNARFDDADHDTPLTHAAGFGRAQVVRLLLQRGANPNAQTDNGKTALWNAADTPLSESGDYSSQGPQPPTPAQRAAWTAAYVDIIRALIAGGANPNLANRNGLTPLAVAAYGGNRAVVEALLQGGANPNRIDRFDKTPLQWAAYIGFPRIVTLLRAHGAWIAPPGLRGPTQRDRDEQLVAAISRRDVTAVKSLLARGADAGAHVNLWNRYSPYMTRGAVTQMKVSLDASGNAEDLVGFQTPLLTAVSSPLITRLLLQRGADPNGQGGEGETPLMDAALDVSRLLLWRGANVNVRDHRGQTPLIKSANDAKKVALLLSRGADVRARNNEGHSALMNCRNEAALRLLLARGANINERDNRGRTALINAADQTWGEGDAAACDAPWSRVLLRHGADPNARDPQGNTALMLLAAQGDYGYYNGGDQRGLVRALLARSARRDLRNRQGRTALQIARRSGAVRLARLLRSRP